MYSLEAVNQSAVWTQPHLWHNVFQAYEISDVYAWSVFEPLCSWIHVEQMNVPSDGMSMSD